MGFDRAAALFRFFFVSTLFFVGLISSFCSLGFFALSITSLPLAPRISVPSRCKIVSSSVDLRTHKVCELGLLNFKAKHVFYLSERKKFRCHYDYYWASVFKVEYQDHFSGEKLLGSAEAPKEALPSDCRPDFSTAFLTKNMLKVNESYDCWYTSSASKVEIFEDSYFGCQVKDPSEMEMIRRYFILSQNMIHLWLVKPATTKGLGLGMLIGTVIGFFMSLLLLGMLKILQTLILKLPRVGTSLIIVLARRVFLSRTFFLLAYLSFVSLLAIQYGKRLGLANFFVEH